MNEFDHFVMRTLGCGAYLRFVDDMLLFADDKRTLWAWRAALMERLAGLRLTIHAGPAQVRPTSEGVRFLGFFVFPQHRRLLRRKGVYYQRKLRRMQALYEAGRLSRVDYVDSLRGWINHVRYGDTWGLRRKLFGGVRIYPHP
ncbi:MAG: RNA-directed DNA polymerase [Caldilineaceae bacterium]|nr:RNA-directed DNA polymerase [Caldilineaceae bacterium]